MNERKLASLWTRVIGAAIDVCILFVITYALCYVWTSSANPSEAYLSPELSSELWKSRFILTWLVSDLVYCAVLMTSNMQATIGQRAVGIKVVKDNGEKIGFGAAISRNLMSILSSIFLKIGFIMATVRKDKKTLHDLVAGTIVINNENSASLDFSKNSSSNNQNYSVARDSINQNTVATTNSSQLVTNWNDSVSRTTEQPINNALSAKNQGYKLEEKKTSSSAIELVTSEKTVPEPLAEDWEKALIEFDDGNLIKGLWARIFAENNGDENTSKAQYIKIRATELASKRRAKIAENRANMYTQATNAMCIRNSALVQVQTNSNFPIYKLANGNFAIYANWKYKIYSDLDSLNNALEMHRTCELFAREGFIEDIAG